MSSPLTEVASQLATSTKEDSVRAPGKELGDVVVEIEHLSKSYKLAGGAEVHALRDVEMHEDGAVAPVRRGEFVMLRGPSGGGKTSFLNCLGCIDTPSSGMLKLFGRAIDTAKASDADLAALRLRNIGFVFQSFNLLATLSAFENVELPMTILGELSPSQRKARAVKLLTMVGLEDRMFHLPSELSGGEQQRVAIARALANNPSLLLLDEATGDLDSVNTVLIMDLLLKLNQEERVTCVMVTHNPDLECYADRILYLADGRFTQQIINSTQSKLDVEAYVDYLARENELGSGF